MTSPYTVIAGVKENVQWSLDILRLNFDAPHSRGYSPKKIVYLTSYVDVRLEDNYRTKNGILCDLTFWAVEFLDYMEKFL